jgi:hypothetical protein
LLLLGDAFKKVVGRAPTAHSEHLVKHLFVLAALLRDIVLRHVVS